MARLLERIEKDLIENKDLSPRDRLWNQGFLAGLKFARQYPAMELDREREKHYLAVEQEKKRPFGALRFKG